MVYTDLAPSISTRHQPCNNQIAVSVHHFGGYLNKTKTKNNNNKNKKCSTIGYSHSFKIPSDMNAASLLESREQRCIKAISNNQ